MGRPRSTMTPEVEEKILRTVKLGLHAERAAQAHGVMVSAFRSHKRRNPDFAIALKKAESEAEGGFLSRIIKHTEKQWTACAWILERRWPERWAKRDPETKPLTKQQVQEAMLEASKAIAEAGGA